jgi:hypothetical protein
MSIDFSGSWRADVEKSRFRGPAPDAITMEITHCDPDLRQEMVVTSPSGAQDQIVFQCRTNGQRDGCLLNGTPIRCRAGWEGKELIIESWLQAGPREMHFRDCWSLSPDGKSLAMEHRDGDLAGQITVFGRVE